MAYALSQMFVAEMLAMFVVIAIGESVIANEVLKRTKGHELGLGFVSFAFGMAFFTAIVMFGQISAVVNPAMLLAKAFVNKMPWRTALVLMVADFIGAFLGAFFVYGVYFAHFSIIPKRPDPPKWNDAYVKAALEPTATRNAYISYEPEVGDSRKETVFRHRVSDNLNANIDSLRLPPLEEYESRQRSNSIQVATLLHAHDSVQETKGEGEFPRIVIHSTRSAEESTGVPPRKSKVLPQPPALRKRWSTMAGVITAELPEPESEISSKRQSARSSIKSNAAARAPAVDAAIDAAQNGNGNGTSPTDEDSQDAQGKLKKSGSKHHHHDEMDDAIQELINEGHDSDVIEAYKGAVLADRNAKLSIFATRPAVFNYAANFVCEMLGTLILVWAALMLEERNLLLTVPDPAASAFFIPIQVGWLVLALVMSLAGPTGYAANPARDFGPRCAHWILPIPNKGPSEWYYSWVPVCACYLGGFLGGCLFALCRLMNNYPDWSEPEINRHVGGVWK